MKKILNWLKSKFSPIPKKERWMGEDWGFDSWVCDSCCKIRPDEKISVLTYSLDPSLGFGERNWKYCNDNPDCETKAALKALEGTL